MSDLELPALSSWFASKSVDGRRQTITRQRTCECGREYTQMLLSGRFMSVVEAQGQNAVEIMLREVPDLFVPVLCPPCESKALGQSVKPAGNWAMPVRRRMEDRGRFAKNMAQLCAAYNKPVDDETSQVFWRALERAMSDDEFERGVVEAVRSEKKWPTPSVIAQYGRAA